MRVSSVAVTPFASTVPEFVALRFVTGIFLSGVIPNAIALVSEMMPARVRATFVSITFAGYTMGVSVIGAPVVKWLVPHGWQYAFVAGGVLPAELQARVTRESEGYFTLRLDSYEDLESVMHALRASGTRVQDMELLQPDLEEVFVKLMHEHGGEKGED